MMFYPSSELAMHAGYRSVEAFQVDQRRHNWPLKPVRKVQGKNYYNLNSLVMSHIISRLKTYGASGSGVNFLFERIEFEILKDGIDEFAAGMHEELIITIPCYKLNIAETQTVHFTRESAYKTLHECDALVIDLTDFINAILSGHM
jgi:hypothetical protein